MLSFYVMLSDTDFILIVVRPISPSNRNNCCFSSSSNRMDDTVFSEYPCFQFFSLWSCLHKHKNLKFLVNQIWFQWSCFVHMVLKTKPIHVVDCHWMLQIFHQCNSSFKFWFRIMDLIEEILFSLGCPNNVMWEFFHFCAGHSVC